MRWGKAFPLIDCLASACSKGNGNPRPSSCSLQPPRYLPRDGRGTLAMPCPPQLLRIILIRTECGKSRGVPAHTACIMEFGVAAGRKSQSRRQKLPSMHRSTMFVHSSIVRPEAWASAERLRTRFAIRPSTTRIVSPIGPLRESAPDLARRVCPAPCNTAAAGGTASSGGNAEAALPANTDRAGNNGFQVLPTAASPENDRDVVGTTVLESQGRTSVTVAQRTWDARFARRSFSGRPRVRKTVREMGECSEGSAGRASDKLWPEIPRDSPLALRRDYRSQSMRQAQTLLVQGECHRFDC